ncbi:hypothetical protein cypCar_00028431 [Cyprinus carpio]|nr:hypothetical protein cypCar_00028431 [Cyprinus carpio]
MFVLWCVCGRAGWRFDHPYGPMGSMAGMEPHHMNGSLGKSVSNTNKHSRTWVIHKPYWTEKSNYLSVQNSPGNLSMSNQPGTPRDDGEIGGNFLNPFQNESVCHFLSASAFVIPLIH